MEQLLLLLLTLLLEEALDESTSEANRALLADPDRCALENALELELFRPIEVQVGDIALAFSFLDDKSRARLILEGKLAFSSTRAGAKPSIPKSC